MKSVPNSSQSVCLFVLLLAGCSVTQASDLVDQQEAALAAQDWSPQILLANSFYNHHGVSVAFLDGTAYAAIRGGGGQCQSQPCDASTMDVFFSQRDVYGTWTTPQLVPSVTAQGLRLTAFNGRLYLLTQPQNETTLVLSRYEPATSTWSSPSTLPFQSSNLPGFTAHGGQLVLLGSQPDWTHMLWMTTMDDQGEFQPAQATSLQGVSASLASHGGSLHAVFRSWPDGYSGEGFGDVMHASFNNVSWTAAEPISMGFGSTVLRGSPSIASYVGDGFDCLQVTALDVNAQTNTSTVWWTFACSGASFAVPVSIVTTSHTWSHSLATSPTELLLAYQTPTGGLGGLDIAARSYHYPSPNGQSCSQPSDCASNLCTASWADLDGDGFGGGTAISLCGSAPAGRVTVGGDCCDSDARVQPGQTQYFTTARTCGGFDFDCNGASERRFPARKRAGCTSVGSCLPHTRCSPCSGPYWSTAKAAPACGATASWRDCFVQKARNGSTSIECGAYFVSTVTQPCR